MAKMHKVDGIECIPIYLISTGRPSTISEDDFIDTVPLPELMMRLKPGERLYLVDYASDPGRTRLTCLI